MRLELKRFLTSCILQCVIIILTMAFGSSIWLGVGLSIWMWVIVLCTSRLYKNIEFVAFLVCFFVFTFGGQVAGEFLGYKYKAVFSPEVEDHTNILLILSVIFLLVGYRLSSMFFPAARRPQKRRKETDEGYTRIVRQISRWAFYFTAIFWYMLMVERVIHYNAFGYYSLYADFSSRLPRAIRTLQNFAPVAFYIFLGTNPSKKEARIPLIIYAGYMVLSLLTGRRIQVAVGLMILITYFVIRNHFSSEKWLTRKMKIVGILMLPAFIVFLQTYSSIRTGETFSVDNVLKTIGDFFGSQGVTVNVIKYGYVYDGQLGENKFFSLYSLLRFLRISPLTNWFMPAHGFEYGAYTAQTAINGNSLANIITYKTMPSTFLMGGGLGSCYIAELFYDFGYAGVCIGNMIYGGLLYMLSQNRNKGIFSTTITFIMLESMLKTPRYNFDLIISDLTMVSNWVFIVFVFILARHMYQKKKSEMRRRVSFRNNS